MTGIAALEAVEGSFLFDWQERSAMLSARTDTRIFDAMIAYLIWVQNSSKKGGSFLIYLKKTTLQWSGISL